MTDPAGRFAALAPYLGVQVPGGCDYCNAYQVVTLIEPMHAEIMVAHDNDCPFLLGRTT